MRRLNETLIHLNAALETIESWKVAEDRKRARAAVLAAIKVVTSCPERDPLEAQLKNEKMAKRWGKRSP